MVAVGREPSGSSRAKITGRLAPFRKKVLQCVATDLPPTTFSVPFCVISWLKIPNTHALGTLESSAIQI